MARTDQDDAHGKGMPRRYVVILADGAFPIRREPLTLLQNASRIVCCDGAVSALFRSGRLPDAVVGDLDSVPAFLKHRFHDRLFHDPGQEDNDLAKAFRFCLERGWRDIVILGASGGREDHTLGNLGWLADFATKARVRLVTDSGEFQVLLQPARIACRPGQPVSLFSFDPEDPLSADGLRYPVRHLRLRRWWMATLNEATGHTLGVSFRKGPVLVFLAHRRGDETCLYQEGRPLAQPAALTIAGSDSGGNAGIQADLRVFQIFGVHGCSAVAALTAQNPSGVRAVRKVSPAFLTAQIEAVLEAYGIRAIKTGMLASAALIEAAGAVLKREASGIPLVVDPVMVATSGSRLIESSAVAALERRLIPLATLVTPNRPEAAVFWGRPIRSRSDAVTAARALAGRWGCAVLLKGGHARHHRGEDLLIEADGRATWFSTPEVVRPLTTHGTGCSLSAAVAALMAVGWPLSEAIPAAKAWLLEALATGRQAGPSAAVMGAPPPADGRWVRREEEG